PSAVELVVGLGDDVLGVVGAEEHGQPEEGGVVQVVEEGEGGFPFRGGWVGYGCVRIGPWRGCDSGERGLLREFGHVGLVQGAGDESGGAGSVVRSGPRGAVSRFRTGLGATGT